MIAQSIAVPEPQFKPVFDGAPIIPSQVNTALRTYRPPGRGNGVRYAEIYTELGIPVIPTCGFRPDGTPTCWYGERCNSPGNRPLSLIKDATTQFKLVWNWWDTEGHEFDNVGVVSGSGLIVIDVDGPDGADQLIDLQMRYDDLPHTLRVRTSRGIHVYLKTDPWYSHPTVRLGPQLEVFGDPGHLVVGAGSYHKSGHGYNWEPGYRPRELENEQLADAPEWLTDLMRGVKQKTINIPRKDPAAPSPAPMYKQVTNKVRVDLYPDLLLKGVRNLTIFNWAVMFRERGFTLEQARYFIEHTHNDVAQPRLSDTELNRQIESAYGYGRRPTRNPNQLGASAMRIHELIVERSTGKPVSFPITEIMTRIGVSRPTVIRALKKLEHLGYVSIERRIGAKTTYMTLDKPVKSEPTGYEQNIPE